MLQLGDLQYAPKDASERPAKRFGLIVGKAEAA
jgi:hypothetical protein